LEITDKHVLVIGCGVAGLSAALELSRLNISVELVEKSNFLGGYSIQFSCKDTDKCVKCGACQVEEKVKIIKFAVAAVEPL
jgi:heterodisulfide reductase subunit A-like polyferredoxin